MNLHGYDIQFLNSQYIFLLSLHLLHVPHPNLDRFKSDPIYHFTTSIDPSVCIYKRYFKNHNSNIFIIPKEISMILYVMKYTIFMLTSKIL